jgi:hypothetical protein
MSLSTPLLQIWRTLLSVIILIVMTLSLPLRGLLLRLRPSTSLPFPQPYLTQSQSHLFTLFLMLLLSIHLWTLFPPLPVIGSCVPLGKPLDLQAIERLTLLPMFTPSLMIIMKIIPEDVSFACK